MYYNCNAGADFAALTGLKKLGVHSIPPLVGRGVLIDMTKHFGVEALEGGQAFTADDIKAAAQAQGVEVREGDVVLFHTGWTDAKLGRTRKPGSHPSRVSATTLRSTSPR